MNKRYNFPNYFFLFFLVISFLIRYGKSIGEIICEEIECKSILIQGNIIFIKDKEDDKKIYLYNDSNNNKTIEKGSYSSLDIKVGKGIKKINEDDFMIYGFKKNNKSFCFQRFSINRNIDIFSNGTSNSTEVLDKNFEETSL